MQDIVADAAHWWIGYKTWLINHIGLTNDAMHVHFAFLILIMTAVLIRKRPDSFLPWLVVLLAELFNEYADLTGNAPGEGTIKASLHDIYNTMFWPTMLLLFGRWLFPRSKQEAKPEENSGDLADEAFHDSSKEPPPV
jgi:hypothetical protein